MLKLGHIIYSNCFPIHAGIVTNKIPFPFKIVEGIPTELNRLLAEGGVDVSPSSSIEYAVNAGRYLILPGFSITSRNRVMSIILQSRVPMSELDNRTVALTSASATSVVLLRILLELQSGASPRFFLYEQGVEEPSGQADAILTIGDLALKKSGTAEFPHVYDLGEVWHEFTGLPFVFALWQVNYKKNIDKELSVLYDILVQSKAYGLSHLRELAREHAFRFGIPPETLIEYWNVFSYDLGESEQKGLSSFYKYAAEIGAIETAPDLKFWRKEK